MAQNYPLFCLSVLCWLRMVLQCSFSNSPIFPPPVCTVSTQCLKILRDKKIFSFLIYGVAISLIHRLRAVAVRLLKGYQEVANDISLCLLPFVTLFLCQIWSCSGPQLLFFLHLCLIYVCIIILYIGPWAVLGSNTGRMCSITVTF